MMRLSAAAVSLCVSLVLVVSSVSAAVQRLNSIDDLKNIYGQDVPEHSLLLLHWFANEVDIDNNDVIRLSFNPNQDYGSHHYGNYENLLQPVNREHQYYTIGNIKRNEGHILPAYVRNYGGGRNMDRIICSIRDDNRYCQCSQRIDEAFITRHKEGGSDSAYDPNHTYQITPNLLREIRELNRDGNSESDNINIYGNNGAAELCDLRNTWGRGAGLLLFKVRRGNVCSKQRYRRFRRATGITYYLGTSDDTITVEVETDTNGKARIKWSNVNGQCYHEGAFVVLFLDNTILHHKQIQSYGGSHTTSVPMNEGLQARLYGDMQEFNCLKILGPEIYRGPKFQSPGKVSIEGYQAWLQLFAKDGKASARFYVRKWFTNWKSEFDNNWVGFYTSEYKSSDDYETWQYVKRFEESDLTSPYYDIYEYKSSMTIAPGVQARFILKKDVKASTPTWN